MLIRHSFSSYPHVSNYFDYGKHEQSLTFNTIPNTERKSEQKEQILEFLMNHRIPYVEIQ